MKRVIVLLVACILTASASWAKGTPDLAQEIESKIFVDLSNIELNQYSPDYVMVSFRVMNDEIKIQEINGTSQELKDIIIKELYEIRVDSPYSEDKTYTYRFTFEKI